MIRHICMFTLKAENKAQHIAEFLERAKSLKNLEMVRRFEAVRNADGTPDSNYDVALVIDFDTVDALNAYQTSPLHVAFGQFVATVKEQRACIDYEF